MSDDKKPVIMDDDFPVTETWKRAGEFAKKNRTAVPLDEARAWATATGDVGGPTDAMRPSPEAYDRLRRALAPMRSPEDVAREMVKVYEARHEVVLDGREDAVIVPCREHYEHPTARKLERILAQTIDRARADGAAAALATPQTRDLASVGHATTCGTCLTALAEEPHRPGCPEPGYIAERQRVAALVRAARRWAAVARRSGGTAEEQIAADLEVVEAVEALDTASAVVAQPRDLADHCRDGLERIARGDAAPREIVDEYLERPHVSDARDLAGRIRALVQEYAGRWADAEDEQRASLFDALVSLRHARDEILNGDGLTAIGWMRESAVDSTRKAADDLERIVCECEAQR
ncbi:hypothetical protein WMF38_57330 [Sorangium sp. So ce118]